MDAVLTEGLSKHYGAVQALRGVNLRVPTGSLFGFLGPNGAGKTTAIRILLGLIRASSGAARVLDRDVWREGAALRADLGYLPGDVRLYDHLSGRSTLDFFDSARGRKSAAEFARLAERFDLDLDKRVRNYSRGMKQKLGLIQALMHKPRLLILDEPTIALDPLIRQVLFEELQQAAADGRTVLFSSHTLSEVEELCDRVAIVRAGRLIEQDTIDALRRRALRRVELHWEGEAPAEPGSAGGSLPNGLRVLQRSTSCMIGTWVGPVAPLLDWLHGQPVRDLIISPPDLEDLFMTYYVEDAA
ncbi:MAG TPA: ABC transporter ATP-binding protein [Phycisphaerae bacterium]|jgi:ABC-2 type transport system ATP-binding protein